MSTELNYARSEKEYWDNEVKLLEKLESLGHEYKHYPAMKDAGGHRLGSHQVCDHCGCWEDSAVSSKQCRGDSLFTVQEDILTTLQSGWTVCADQTPED